MASNVTNIKTSSDRVWRGDNPLNYAFPLLIFQTTLVLFISRFLAFLLKPLRQPTVVAEILGGIMLGPSVLGRNKELYRLVFPPWSTPILESVASIGLLFFLFLVGLELDFSLLISHNGKRAFGIALAGIFLPFLAAAGVSFFLRKAIPCEDKAGTGQYLLFMGVALSITAFPVLARVLAELKLLTTPVGQTAMAAAAFNDVAAWILLALGVDLAGNGSTGGDSKSSLIPLWVLCSGVAFVAFMIICIRPMMHWLARRSCSSQQDFLDEACMCLTLAGVMLSGFMTDLIGIHAIFGAFVFGLTVPKGGEFEARLIKRIEHFVSCLLLPLYSASSGLKTDVAKIRGLEAWELLLLVISSACAGKILGTFVMAILCMIPARESLALGVLMNTKGLVELIVLNIGKEKKVLNDEMFTILVLMALFTTIMTTPIVKVIYKPPHLITSQACRGIEQQSTMAEISQEELRILACVHGTENVPALINLIESTRAAKKCQLKLYVMRLVELTDRSFAIKMIQRVRKAGVPLLNRFCCTESHDQIAAPFKMFGQVSWLSIDHLAAISALPTMHEDIFHVAEGRRVGMIIMPFHRQWRGGGAEAIQSVGYGWRCVNQNVLQTAPCTVAILIDRGLGSSDQEAQAISMAHERVCILFFGGPDDRETLKLGGLMTENPTISLTVIRFLENSQSAVRIENNNCFVQAYPNHRTEKELDEAAVEDLRIRWNESIKYTQKEVDSIKEEVITIGQSKQFALLVVGKRAAVALMPDNQVEYPELGPVGDILASSDNGTIPAVLVIQQHDLTRAEEINMSTMV